MSKDLSHGPGVSRREGAAANPLGRGAGRARTASASVRDEYLEKGRRLVADLTRCHEEIEVLGPLIQELRSISKLQESFSFSDAMAFSSQNQCCGDGEHAVFALKSRISFAVQYNAGQAETFCPTPEERAAFMSRLERQFQEIQRKLVDQERQRCAEKLNALCSRLDLVVESLAEFPERTRKSEALLAVMAQALRGYTRDSLGEPSIQIGQQNVGERRDAAQPSSMKVSQFLKLLDDVAVEALCDFIDYAAA